MSPVSRLCCNVFHTGSTFIYSHVISSTEARCIAQRHPSSQDSLPAPHLKCGFRLERRVCQYERSLLFPRAKLSKLRQHTAAPSHPQGAERDAHLLRHPALVNNMRKPTVDYGIEGEQFPVWEKHKGGVGPTPLPSRRCPAAPPSLE